MPLMRYFCYVGGILLALLFVADACFPKLPDAHGAGAVSYVIRIHSDRKWPERVVYDTSHPTITGVIPAQIANIAASAPAPATIAPLKVREAFAQLRPPDASQLQSSYSKKREPKGHRHANMAKRHMPPPLLLVARQRQFGWVAYW